MGWLSGTSSDLGYFSRRFSTVFCASGKNMFADGFTVVDSYVFSMFALFFEC